MPSQPLTTPIPLDRDAFMRRLIASLGHLNEGILGSEVAGGYVTNVGLSMGSAIEAEYKRYLAIDRPFTLDEYAHVIVDLKQKIEGNFSLIAATPEYVEVETTSCPFEEFVRESPSLCFMTSSVFGGIAARNFGYGKVVLHKRIALGDPGCHVTVYLQPTDAAKAAIGREYFPDQDQASPDINEQLRLMERMRQLRDRLERTSLQWDALVEAGPGGIVVVDSDGRIAFANSYWRELAGVEGAELVGNDLFQVAHDDGRSVLAGVLEQLASGERVTGEELRIKHRVGAPRVAVVSGGPLRSETGELYGGMLLFQDVTERAEVERMKEEFLQASSHEMSTPITTIRGMTQYLLAALNADRLNPEDLAERLRHIQREADRLVMLGNDLADALRMRARGRMQLELDRADIRELVQEELDEERPFSKQVQATLDAPAHPVFAKVDRRRMAQVIDNLISNAQKYSPDGGIVVTSIREVEGYVEVTVRDEGIGIPADELGEIFDPFVRGSNTSTLNYPGTGLGLYIARAIAEAHGGSLSVTSEFDQGSTFTLKLPN